MQGTPGSRSVARLPRPPNARTAIDELHGRRTERKLALNRPALEARIKALRDPLGVSAITTTRSPGRNDSPRTTRGCVQTSLSFGVVAAVAVAVGRAATRAVAQTAVMAASVRITCRR